MQWYAFLCLLISECINNKKFPVLGTPITKGDFRLGSIVDFRGNVSLYVPTFSPVLTFSQLILRFTVPGVIGAARPRKFSRT